MLNVPKLYHSRICYTKSTKAFLGEPLWLIFKLQSVFYQSLVIQWFCLLSTTLGSTKDVM